METRNCQNCKNDFNIEPDDFSFYEKIKVPPPTFCPECRLIRKLARRNERFFHKIVCGKCDKNTISIFGEHSNVEVYCSYCWWADDWDAIEYGEEFDSSKNVFMQIEELFHRVPQMNLNGLYQTKVNSEYTHMASWLKNCFMVTYSDYCENVIYGSFINHTKDSVDNLMGAKLELCYETINCSQCYRTLYSIDCESCTDVWFSKNCSGCISCFGCVNLKNKSYYIYNEPYSKKEYEKKLEEVIPKTVSEADAIKDEIVKMSRQFPQKYYHGWRNVDSTGDYLNDSKNAKDCFIGFNIEDSRYCSFVTGKMTDSYDFINFGQGSSLMYEILQGGDQCQNLRMSQFIITNCQNVDYSYYCIGCSDIFGCVGLRKKQYCIFNKQYTKEDYFKLREIIISHMNENPYVDKQGLIYKYGEFFPIETSVFPYNETTAQEFFPMSKQIALEKGYLWIEPEGKTHKITIKNEDLPKTFDQLKESVLSEIIECRHKGLCAHQCTQAFKIIPEEFEFYRKMKLPLPRSCPNCRHGERTLYRTPMKLHHRQCMCDKDGHEHQGTCPVEFETSYAPERPEIVYCESCYQKEVI